jgi:hypothetical protein
VRTASRSRAGRSIKLPNGITVSEPASSANGLWLNRLRPPDGAQIEFRESRSWATFSVRTPRGIDAWSTDLRGGGYAQQIAGSARTSAHYRHFINRAREAHDAFTHGFRKGQPHLRGAFDAAAPATWSSMQLQASATGATWLLSAARRRRGALAWLRKRRLERHVDRALRAAR